MKILTIGRHESNEIVVDDAKVSRNHLQIIQDDDNNFTLVDLNSTNGTFVNGQKVTGEVPLQPNDTIRVGNTPVVWQEYFLRPSTSSKSNDSVSGSTHKRTRLYVLIGTIALILIIAAFFLIAYNNRQNEARLNEERAKIEAERRREGNELQSQIEAEREAVKARLEFEDAEKQRMAKEKSIVEIEKRELAATSYAERKRLGDSLTRSRAELEVLKGKEQTASNQLSVANRRVSDLEAQNQQLSSDLGNARKKIQDDACLIEHQQAELDRLKNERLNLLNKDFSTLLKSVDFIAVAPSRMADNLSEEQWRDKFSQADDFEKKRQVYEELKQALQRKKYGAAKTTE